MLELLIARPDCTAAARDRVNAEHFNAGAGRLIFETCSRLDDEGIVPKFDRLMLEFDSPEMKNLLVELDEKGRAKGRQTADPEALLDELARTRTRKEVERQRPADIAALREGGLDVRQQATMLEEIIRQKRDQ